MSPPRSPILKYSSVFIFAVLLVIGYFSVFNVSPDQALRTDSSGVTSAEYPRIDTSPGSCTAPPTNAPVFFYLKTKAHVTYDAGHWFHMAEIFMASYSKLRATYAYANSSVVYFIFDNKNFVKTLNGMTRYMLTAGMTDGEVKEVHFAYAEMDTSKLVPFQGAVSFSGVWASDAKEAFDLRQSVPTADRYVVPLSRGGGVGSTNVKQCMIFGGTLGGVFPTLQRGHWFPNPLDREVFRVRTAKLCPRDDVLMRAIDAGLTSTGAGGITVLPPLNRSAASEKPKYRLVLYQRDLTRKLLDHEVGLRELQMRLGSDWSIELAHLLAGVQVLLTPHGFQSMLLLLLPRPSLLFELFPYKYQKRGYAPLSKDLGFDYDGAMSPAVSTSRAMLLGLVNTQTCMDVKQCRTFAREDDVRMTEAGIVKVVNAAHRQRFKVDSCNAAFAKKSLASSAGAGNSGAVGFLKEAISGVNNLLSGGHNAAPSSSSSSSSSGSGSGKGSRNITKLILTAYHTAMTLSSSSSTTSTAPSGGGIATDIGVAIAEGYNKLVSAAASAIAEPPVSGSSGANTNTNTNAGGSGHGRKEKIASDGRKTQSSDNQRHDDHDTKPSDSHAKPSDSLAKPSDNHAKPCDNSTRGKDHGASKTQPSQRQRKLQHSQQGQQQQHAVTPGGVTVSSSDSKANNIGYMHAVSSNTIARRISEPILVTPPQDHILTHEGARSSPIEVYCDSFY